MLGIGSVLTPATQSGSTVQSSSQFYQQTNSQQQQHQQQSQESTSIYISKLPTDITEEELGKYQLYTYYDNLFLWYRLFFFLILPSDSHRLIWLFYLLIEILFGPLGKVKKVKIYTTALGKQKGDALLTFVQAESAATACIKVRKGSNLQCVEQIYEFIFCLRKIVIFPFQMHIFQFIVQWIEYWRWPYYKCCEGWDWFNEHYCHKQ